MNLKQLASHTVDLDLLGTFPNVLDVGCRWWDFSKAILAENANAMVLGVDPDPAMAPPDDVRISWECAALIGGQETQADYHNIGDGISSFLDGQVPPYMHQLREGYAAKGEHRRLSVPCTNIAALMKKHGLSFFDVVKLDCECSEFQILENWPGRIARQISVEFHDYTHRDKWNDVYFGKLFAHLAGHGYKVVQHEDILVGGGWGHWDSLLVLG